MLSYERTIELLLPLEGETVRIKYGALGSRQGKVGFETIGCHENCLTLDGSFVGGELAGATEVQVKGTNGRYAAC